MLKFAFLTKDFYEDYKHCPEIEKKEKRPYIRISIKINNRLFGIPLRSNINHPHVLWTDKENHCGVDFSKAVIIVDPLRYINMEVSPYIRPLEFDALRGKEFQIQDRMAKYIVKYKQAKKHLDITRNRMLVTCSTLQYFEEYL